MSESQEPEQTHQLTDECDDDTPCEETFCDTKRRRLLGAVAASGSIALAGCTGMLASPDEPDIRGSGDEYEINFLREQEELTVRGSETILRAAERNDIEMNYACRAGYCGQCLSQADVDANEAVHMSINNVGDLNEEAVEAGYFLPCTSQPRSDFTITTNQSINDLAEFQEEDEDEDDDDDEDDESQFVTYLVERQGTTIEFEPGDDRDLLEAGLDEGLDLEYQCTVGSCGLCVSKVSGDARNYVDMDEGEAAGLDDAAADMDEGWFLPCIATPIADFVMRANMVDEY